MAVTANKGLILQATGTNPGTWGDELNDNALSIIDLNLGGLYSFALASTTPETISATNARNLIYRATGTLSANITVRHQTIGIYAVENRTSGAFTVSVVFWNGASQVGSSVEIPQGYSVLIIADSTNGCRKAQDAPASTYVAGSITTAAIADANVTFAKVQNVATSRLLGRTTASSGSIEELTAGTGLTLSGGSLSVTTPAATTLISTTTVSSAAQLGITSGIDASYDEYEIHLVNLRPDTNATALRLQVSTDGGSTWKSTSYAVSLISYNSTGGSSSDASAAATFIPVVLTAAAFPSNSSTGGWCGLIRFWPNGSATRKQFLINGTYLLSGAVEFGWVQGMGTWGGGNDAVNAVRFVAASGNVTGTARLIGVKNT